MHCERISQSVVSKPQVSKIQYEIKLHANCHCPAAYSIITIHTAINTGLSICFLFDSIFVVVVAFVVAIIIIAIVRAATVAVTTLVVSLSLC